MSLAISSRTTEGAMVDSIEAREQGIDLTFGDGRPRKACAVVALCSGLPSGCSVVVVMMISKIGGESVGRLHSVCSTLESTPQECRLERETVGASSGGAWCRATSWVVRWEWGWWRLVVVMGTERELPVRCKRQSASIIIAQYPSCEPCGGTPRNRKRIGPEGRHTTSYQEIVGYHSYTSGGTSGMPYCSNTEEGRNRSIKSNQISTWHHHYHRHMSALPSIPGSAVAVAGALAVLARVALKARAGKGKGKGGAKGQSKTASVGDTLQITLDRARFLELLRKLIGESKFVQNFPPDHVPEEDLVVRHILAELEPHLEKSGKGGLLEVRTISYAPGRSNVIITLRGSLPRDRQRPVTLIGSHLDVVPADPAAWERNPFELVVEGDKCYGRGTTDCLGHVALITQFFASLSERFAKAGTRPRNDLVAVFIASEENDSIKGVGIDGLSEAGELDALRNGPLLWVDAADSQPCMGTAGALPWRMTVHGKRFHSGLPHRAINPIELGSEVLAYVQRRFYEDFPPTSAEAHYKFATPSTLKPTQIKCGSGSLNTIPPTCTISGDIRLTPFYDVHAAMRAVDGYVRELNEGGLTDLPVRGPVSKYELPEENLRGRVEIEWLSAGGGMAGIATDLDSYNFSALCEAFESATGGCKPYSINGSLPLVREMQDRGFQLCITGFGLSSVYHADNEYLLLSDFEKGCRVLSTWCSKCDAVE